MITVIKLVKFREPKTFLIVVQNANLQVLE